MKKLTAIFLLLMLALSGCGTADTPSAPPENSAQPPSAAPSVSPTEQPAGTPAPAESGAPVQSGGVLIAYFTAPEDVEPDGVDAVAEASIVVSEGEKLGNTEYVARLIQQAAGGELFRIETVQAYPLDHDPLVDQAADEQDEDARPQLASHIENLDQYETILLGYPNWWGDLPMPLYSFLEEYDFGGKTVIPFVTNGGSGASRTIDTISELEPEAQIYEDALVISRNDVADSAKTVTDWAKGLALQERSQEALLQETAVLETAAASSGSPGRPAPPQSGT